MEQINEQNVMTKTVEELAAFAKEAEEATAKFVQNVRVAAVSFVNEHIASGTTQEEQGDKFQIALSAVLTGCGLEAARAISVLSQGNAEVRSKMIDHFADILRQETENIAKSIEEAAKLAQEASQTEQPAETEQPVVEGA